MLIATQAVYALTPNAQAQPPVLLVQEQNVTDCISFLADKLFAATDLLSKGYQRLIALSPKYDDISTDGTKPLAETSLAKLRVELRDERKLLTRPPRVVSHTKCEETRKIV